VSGILDNLEVGKRALIAQQAVLNTIGHNLANAATPGYSRQRAELVPVQPQGGVDVIAVQRIRDRYLDFSLMIESQALGQYQAQQGLLQRLQAVFNDPPGTGLTSMLDQFFQSFEDLSINPTDQAFRVTLRDRGDRLASTVRGLWSRVDQLKNDLTTQIQEKVTTANGLLTQIADLNRQVLGSGGGPPPNDLLDKRDHLVEQLNQIVGVSATDRTDGTVQLAVTGTGVLLVDGTFTAPLAAAVNLGTDSVDLTAGSVAVTPQGGELAAVLTGRNSPTGSVKQAASDLNSLARSVIAEVNRLHAGGTGLAEPTSLTALNPVSSAVVALTAAGLPFTPGSGSFQVIVHDATGAVSSSVTVSVTAGVTTLTNVAAAINADSDLNATISGGKLTVAAAAGLTFTFASDTSDTLMALGLNTFFSGSVARDMALNPVIAADANTISAAQADTAGLVRPGDGANALALAQLRTKLTMSGGTATFSDFFGTTIARVGSQMAQANDAVDRQQAAVQVVQSLQQQTSGVSTDEEMIALTQSQSAYAAAAKYIGTVQEMIHTLLNMMTVTA
jgi:flagellar hook-associated protein 1 FlgK